MIEFYQNIPALLDPIALSIGSFSIRWYSLMYFFSFTLTLLLVFWRLRCGEGDNIFCKKNINNRYGFFLDIFLIGFSGIIIGGRLGYAFFYNPMYFIKYPLSLISPFNFETGEYIGISGMSYFGAIIGIVIFEWIYLHKNKINFWKIADFIVPAAAAGYTMGRIGNFINGELIGKKTDIFLGMNFTEDLSLRHPSQLYEAFFEGIIIFVILWLIRNKAKFDGQIVLIYFMLYSFFRYFLENIRESGAGEKIFGDILTKGQMFSIILFFICIWIYFQIRRKNAII